MTFFLKILSSNTKERDGVVSRVFYMLDSDELDILAVQIASCSSANIAAVVIN